MPAITFMNNPYYVDDRNDIISNSEHALQQLEKKNLLTTSKLTNNAESLGQGNTIEDIESQEEQFYNNNLNELENNFQESLENLYSSYLGAYTDAFGDVSISSVIRQTLNTVLKEFTNKMIDKFL